jgi:hypothetical protein
VNKKFVLAILQRFSYPIKSRKKMVELGIIISKNHRNRATDIQGLGFIIVAQEHLHTTVHNRNDNEPQP